MLTKKPYRGTRDLFPDDKRVQDFLFAGMKKVAESFGYEPYDGPLLEELDLYRAKSGEELVDEQIYSFVDRGGRQVAIRPEMTPTLARMVAGSHKGMAKPIRWYSIPNLMRYERPQKGRLREHWQFNCDIFGAGPYGELEILQVAAALLTEFGADERHFEILVNDRRIVDWVFREVLKADPGQSRGLYKIADKAKKVPGPELRKMVADLDAGMVDKFFEYLDLDADKLESYADSEVLSGHLKLWRLLQDLGLGKYVKFDPAVVRGLDYYTGLVFEIFDKNPENKRALCGGGAYADILKIFEARPLPGVGFGLGDVTLRDFLSGHGLLPDLRERVDLVVTYQAEGAAGEACKIANGFRSLGLKVMFQFEPLNAKKVFPLARKRGGRFAVLMGDREFENKTFQVKALETQREHVFSWDQIGEASGFCR